MLLEPPIFGERTSVIMTNKPLEAYLIPAKKYPTPLILHYHQWAMAVNLNSIGRGIFFVDGPCYNIPDSERVTLIN